MSNYARDAEKEEAVRILAYFAGKGDTGDALSIARQDLRPVLGLSPADTTLLVDAKALSFSGDISEPAMFDRRVLEEIAGKSMAQVAADARKVRIA